MPDFTREPPPLPDGFIYRIIRTPAKGAIQAIVTSPEVVGCNTHFVNSRTVPCEGLGTCPMCDDGHSRRWHGYLAAILTNCLEHILFEFTAHASDTFKNYYLAHTTLRACAFKAYRPSQRPNGRVVIHTSPADEARFPLPEPPDLRKILCHIWNCQYTPPVKTGMCRPPFKDAQVGGNGDRAQAGPQHLPRL
jgi:hypothetical protein